MAFLSPPGARGTTLLEAEIGRTFPDATQDVQVLTHKTQRGARTEFDKLSNLTQAERAQKNGIGIVSQRKLDHLAGYREDLLHEVQRGALSLRDNECHPERRPTRCPPQGARP